MSLKSKEPEDKKLIFEPIPQGSHIGICYSIIDIGTQKKEYSGKIKEQSKIIITWELPKVRMLIDKDGNNINKPKAISREYTNSLHKKANLRNDLEVWLARKLSIEELISFDLTSLIGKNCLLNVIHNKSDDGEKTYVNVSAIMALPDGTPISNIENDAIAFDIDCIKEPDFAGLDTEKIPAFILNKIMVSKEWQQYIDKTEPIPPTNQQINNTQRNSDTQGFYKPPATKQPFVDNPNDDGIADDEKLPDPVYDSPDDDDEVPY